ncbi:hypothetical protein NBO_10g0069 [Nosema bombycis CQ1]|uniref:Uncharacterized protein n=1 Tax=Nosema bombycis (strain CQ1 / CVCC 102059) TaxID=578461 RepID=R0MAT5_NOSB1|nr:hypothetical protein NBO_10g0069 [Nosema bombycis CQ1]|eukprot:EOB15079.1 hypothetical protein NBO_10g0069 [Nosema bombycis CQ1]
MKLEELMDTATIITGNYTMIFNDNNVQKILLFLVEAATIITGNYTVIFQKITVFK